MSRSKPSTWIIGTVLVALLLVAAIWFLLISPTMAKASDTRTQASTVEASNEQLRTQMNRLADQFKHLDEYKADLAKLRAQIPAEPDLAAYLRQLDGVASAHSVTLTAITPGTATAFAPVVAQSAQSTDVQGAGTTSTSNSDTSTPQPAATKAAAPASSIPAGMVAVPLSVTAVGTYDAIDSFLDAIQTQTPRLFLVSTVAGTSQKDQAASGGRPATHLGDLEATVTGYLYVLPATTKPAAPTPTPTAPPALPGAVSGKNPLVPIG